MNRFSRAILFFSVLLVTSCGSNSQDNLSASFAEFENSPPRAVNNLISAFGIESDGKAGGVIAFYTNQRYFSGIVQKISDVHYRIAATVGIYSEQNGAFQMRAYKTTCQKLAQKYKGAAKVSGSTTADYLTVTTGSSMAVLARLPAPSSALKNGFVIEFGCFEEKTGRFTPEGWSLF